MVSSGQLLGFTLASFVLIVVPGGLAMIGLGVTVAFTGRRS